MSSPEDTRCPVCGDPFDYDVSCFSTEQDKRTSRLPLFSHQCPHNVCATCIVEWDSKGSRFNKWQKCPVCRKPTSFNARVLPNGIDLNKCTLLRMAAHASAAAGSVSTATAIAGSTSTASASAASSAMTSTATATATNSNEGGSGLPAAVAESHVTARDERIIRRNAVREVALANAAAARAARSARSASPTTMTSPDQGRETDSKSGLTGSNIGHTSPSANVAPSNTMRRDSSAATDVSSDAAPVARPNRAAGIVPTDFGVPTPFPAQLLTDAAPPTSNSPNTDTHDGLSSVIGNLQSFSISPAQATTSASTRAQVSQDGTAVDSAERAAQSASLVSQEEIDQQLAQTLSRQSLQEYRRNGGNLEDILRHNSVGDGAFLNATFDLFLPRLGNNVIIENLNTYAALDNAQLRPNILQRLRQNVPAVVVSTAYNSATNLAGSGHFGAVIRLQEPFSSQQNPRFFWLYIDTESTGREGRQAAVLQHLRRHQVIWRGEDFRFFPAFPQAENECVASTPYVVLAILHRYLNGESIYDLQFRGAYNSMIIRSWMYYSLRDEDPIQPLNDFDDMAAMLEARASPPILEGVSAPAPSTATATATATATSANTGLFGASSFPGTNLPGSETNGFRLGSLVTASSGGTASDLLSGPPAPSASPGGFGLSSTNVAGTSGAALGVLPALSTAAGTSTGLFAAPAQAPARPLEPSTNVSGTTANGGFRLGFLGTASTDRAASGLQIATRENGTNLVSATAPSLPSPGVSNSFTASPTTGTFGFGTAFPNALGANGTSIFGSPAPSVSSPSISNPSTAASRAGVVSFGATSIFGTGGGTVSGVPSSGPNTTGASTGVFGAPAPSVSSPSISRPCPASQSPSVFPSGASVDSDIERTAAAQASTSLVRAGTVASGLGFDSPTPTPASQSPSVLPSCATGLSAVARHNAELSLMARQPGLGVPDPGVMAPGGNPEDHWNDVASDLEDPDVEADGDARAVAANASLHALRRSNRSNHDNAVLRVYLEQDGELRACSRCQPTVTTNSSPPASSIIANGFGLATAAASAVPSAFTGTGRIQDLRTSTTFFGSSLSPASHQDSFSLGASDAAVAGTASTGAQANNANFGNSPTLAPTEHGNTVDNHAPVTFGPNAQPHSVTSRADGATLINLQSISAMRDSYEGWSHEELRLADYVEARRQQELLRRNGNGSGNGPGTG